MLLMCRRQISLLIVLLAVWAAPAVAVPANVDHTAWEELTEHHVANGRVDYIGVARERATLERYLALLGSADPAKLPSDKARLVFWINAYNACVFKGVLDHYPLKSVKDVRGFFDKLRYHVAGRNLTLNDIEAQGRSLHDWRIHFAVVCASASCPPIRSEAYTAQWLEPQLTEQVKEFLKNAKDGFRVEGNVLLASSIFKWYAKDFVPGKMSADALLEVLKPYLDPAVFEAAHGHQLNLKFLSYDWSLNAKPQPGGR